MFTAHSSQLNSKFKTCFTACCLLFLLAMPASAATGHFSQPTTTNIPSFFMGYFKINGVDAQPGDEVAFFDPQGVLCGLYVVDTPGKYGRVTVYGDDNTTPSVDKGASSGDILTVKIWDKSAGIELEGTSISLSQGFFDGNPIPSLIPPQWQYNTDYALNIDTATHFTKPDPLSYYGSSVFWGNLTIKGQLPDAGDEIGVFDASGTVIGHFLVTTPDKYGYLNVYGNHGIHSGKPLNFKLWDKSAGIEYPMSNLILKQGTPPDGSSFVASPVPPIWTDNTTYALDIEVPQGSVNQFVIPLNAGWNFVSTPIQPTDPKIESVFAGVGVNTVWAYNGQTKTWKKYKASAASNELTTIDAGVGYWIYMNSAAQLTVYGTDASPAIRLYEGWNLIGYNGVDNAGIETKLSNITESWSIIWNWQNGIWKLNGNSNPAIPFPSIFSSKTLTKLNRGKAYWVKVKTAVDWQQ